SSDVCSSDLFSPIIVNKPSSNNVWWSPTGIVNSFSTLFTFSTITSASSEANCAPSDPYTLKPLYGDGLWLAVITIPLNACKYRTANDSSGVVRNDSKTYV